MSTHFAASPMGRADDPVAAQDRFADRFTLATLAIGALLAVAIGQAHGQLGTAILGALALLGLGAATALLSPSPLLRRLVLAATAMGMVGLQIQVGRGTLEYHFGVFVTLALLLVYRDWRPLVAGAGVIAVHHVAADRLQAAGWAVYCTPTPDFLKVLLHAVYVVVQTSLEVYLAVVMRNTERTGIELSRLVGHVTRGERVCLDMAPVQADADAALALRAALQRVDGALVQVRSSVGGMQVAATEIASGNQDLSERTERTAASLQQAASLMQQITEAVRHSADASASAEQLAGSAAQVAQRGGSQVGQVVSTMGEIQASSRKISDIIGTIDGIAFQTNILALNAAVEAARAGEQGRGFAVVAGEVRSLAQRSASAAREIKTLISASVERVESGTRLVQDAGSTVAEIVSSVQRVADIIGEVNAAASEQRNGIEQLNSSISALDQSTQQNAALVEEGAAVSASLREHAQGLADAVAAFELSAGDTAPARPQQVAKALVQRARTGTTPSARTSAAPVARPAQTRVAPVTVATPAAASTASDDDWQSF